MLLIKQLRPSYQRQLQVAKVFLNSFHHPAPKNLLLWLLHPATAIKKTQYLELLPRICLQELEGSSDAGQLTLLTGIFLLIEAVFISPVSGGLLIQYAVYQGGRGQGYPSGNHEQQGEVLDGCDVLLMWLLAHHSYFGVCSLASIRTNLHGSFVVH